MPNTLSVYKISFKKFLSEESSISDNDLDNIANLDIESSFDYEKDELYHCFVLTSKNEIEKYKDILYKNNIEFYYSDVSELLINNEYDINEIKKYLDNDNYYIYEIFLEDINNWIYSELNIDIILDIISSKGISSLRPVDKKFLKDNYEK